MTADTDIKGVGAEAKSCGAESAGDAIIDQAAQVQCGEPVVDATNATVATSGDASRPSNEEIIAQENAIRKEQEGRQLVGVIEPLSSLSDEYVDPIILAKIAGMEGTGRADRATPGCSDRADGIDSIRRTRGDGNCFYRSFIFGYLEQMVRNADVKEAAKAKAAFTEWGNKLNKHGFHELVYADALEEMVSQLDTIIEGQMSVENLHATYNNQDIASYIIMLLRFITSSELQTREDFFAPFVVGMTESINDVTQFCRQCVEPMGEESDHAHIIALTDALQVPIRVFYLDRSSHGTQDDTDVATTHDFSPTGCFPGVFYVTLLYRPGHYDLVYNRSEGMILQATT